MSDGDDTKVAAAGDHSDVMDAATTAAAAADDGAAAHADDSTAKHDSSAAAAEAAEDSGAAADGAKKDDDEENGDAAEDDEKKDDEDGKPMDEGDEDESEDDKNTTVEGRRERKAPKSIYTPPPQADKKPLVVGNGRGTPLGTIASVSDELSKRKPEDLKDLHKVLFGTPGVKTQVKTHIKQFNGWDREATKEALAKKRVEVEKLPVKTLSDICAIFGLKRSGNRPQMADELMDYLTKPKGAAAKSPAKAKSPTSASKNAAPAKSPASTKSPALAKKPSSDKKASAKTASPASSPADKKKRQSADTVEEESEEDDTPLAKKLAKAAMPSDDAITKQVAVLLKTADLTELTNNKVVAQLTEHFGVDMAPKKSLVKQTIEKIIKTL